MSVPVSKSDTMRSTDSAGYQWEEVPLPEPLAAEHEHLIPPAKTAIVSVASRPAQTLLI